MIDFLLFTREAAKKIKIKNLNGSAIKERGGG